MNDLRSSFSAFFDDNYDSVCRGLSVALGDPALAEEAAQEAFTRAYVWWHRVSQMERPTGWVYVTAIRVATRKRPFQTAEEATPAVDPSEVIVDQLALGAAIDSLPERQRLAVVLRYGFDLSLGDIATAMGCAVGTVKSTLHSALKRLHVTLEDSLQEVEHDAGR